MKSATQFGTLVVMEKDKNNVAQERVVTDQKTIEWEVRKLYWKLYRKQEVKVNMEEVRNMTGHIKKIPDVECTILEKKITMDDLSRCLKNTKNNVAPGSGRFSGAELYTRSSKTSNSPSP